jgi:hypothetical protein
MVIAILTWGSGMSRAADPPLVQFDCGPAVVCRDVTPVDFALSNPDEKVIEATVEISTRVSGGPAEDLRQLVYEVESPYVRIFDFSPRTQLSSEFVEPIQIVKTVGKNRTVGGAVTGTMAAPIPLPINAQPMASLGTNEQNSVREEMRKMPAKIPVIISGTFGQQQGVFFKFKQSNQTSLEGVRKLTCSFVVPRDWRGDYLLLSCKASGLRTRYLIKGVHSCGDARFVVGLYLEGDSKAKQAALALAATQLTLRREGGQLDEALGKGEKKGVREAADLLRSFAGDVR